MQNKFANIGNRGRFRLRGGEVNPADKHTSNPKSECTQSAVNCIQQISRHLTNRHPTQQIQQAECNPSQQHVSNPADIQPNRHSKYTQSAE